MDATRRHRTVTAIAALLGLLVIAGCSSGNGAGGTDSAGGAATERVQKDAPGPSNVDGVLSFSASGDLFAAAQGARPSATDGSSGSLAQPVTDRQVISTGALTLESDDIAKARQAAIDIVKQAGGHIDNEESLAAEDGKMTHSSLVFRVPAKEFDSVMNQLADVAAAVRQSRQAQDVTAKVIDVAARIRVQESSIRRLEVLYARATTIGQIISLESQLSRRQADLDSLKQRQAWLRNQTSLSTISLTITEPGEVKPEPPKKHRGFLKGLYAGWDALVTMTMGVLAGLGAALPFLGVLIVLVIGFRVYRRVRR